jgi:calcineurin-like phosphoesterase family protein
MWNSRVGDTDTIFIVGDFMFRNVKPPEEYLKRLAGRKRLIIGNHDKEWLKQCDTSKYFESVGHYDEIEDEDRKIVLSHYPMMSWNMMEIGSYMIHGHIHKGTKGLFFPFLAVTDKILNAGVDINNFTPVTLSELTENNRAFKEAYLAKQANIASLPDPSSK